MVMVTIELVIERYAVISRGLPERYTLLAVSRLGGGEGYGVVRMILDLGGQRREVGRAGSFRG